MRRAVAIFLLSLSMYNAGGYLFVFQYLIYQSDKYDEVQISQGKFKTSDLVEIKIPVHLFGISDWRGYESISGSVNLKGNAYNYVRMKMTTDTIYVMCVPNYSTTKLLKQNMLYAKEVSDASLNSKKSSTQIKFQKATEHLCFSVLNNDILDFQLLNKGFGELMMKTVKGELLQRCKPPEIFS